MKVVAQFGSLERPMVLLDMGDGSHIELVESIAFFKGPNSEEIEFFKTHQD